MLASHAGGFHLKPAAGRRSSIHSRGPESQARMLAPDSCSPVIGSGSAGFPASEGKNQAFLHAKINIWRDLCNKE
jgi:hypothetical protein